MNPINEPFYPTASVFANEQQNFWTVIEKPHLVIGCSRPPEQMLYIGSIQKPIEVLLTYLMCVICTTDISIID